MKTATAKRISFGCMILIMPLLVVSTIIEKLYGTSFVISNIYHSPFFVALWAILVISAMTYIICISKRKTLLMLHLSLAMVLVGAFVSFMTSKRGEIILPKDSVPASMFTTAKGELEKLPFRLELIDADTCYNKEEIIDYTADIVISQKNDKAEIVHISLNKPARVIGYTLCIKAIHKEYTTLLISYDPWGTAVSYIGYLLTAISFILIFFDKKSTFSKILSSCNYRIGFKSIAIAVCIIILAISRIITFTGSDSQPILNTPILSLHVATIIVAYSLIGCAAFNSLRALTFDKEKSERAAQLGRLLLYPATMLLTTGIFIGAMWANISWGRYWGWDPKEVWALLTLLICSITFHKRSLPFISRARNFHLFCILIFIVMLFTYFGVNYLLSGLHSYA